MKKINIGITGQNGFIGSHLYNTLILKSNTFNIINFEKSYFKNITKLDRFVTQCDVIIHLAALNRHESDSVIFNTNVDLVSLIIDSLNRTNCTPHIVISSSIQEKNNGFYGKSKKIGRKMFRDWAKNSNATFTGLIVPNVFGPFGKPFYNSVVATFCHQLTANQNPIIKVDSKLELIYVIELVDIIIDVIEKKINQHEYFVEPTSFVKVSELLELLKKYQLQYFKNGEIPLLKNSFELNLFNSFRSYIDFKNYFPRLFKQNNDNRGSFVELVRLGIGGQISFSTTLAGVTRGNHFHTRKIERFAVIKGKALIQLRRIGTNEVLNFYLDGYNPSYVDMPIWYTHNIKNIGDDILYTIFWINEAYDEKNSDTFFEEV